MILILICLASNSQNGNDSFYNRSILSLENWKFQGGNDPIDASSVTYKDKKWETVELPHSWVTATQNRNLKFSNAWYRSSFRSEANSNIQQVFLLFERVSINSEVYVNGNLVGTHKGAMNAFIFNITEYLADGESHTVAVKVSNEMDLQAMPASYAGGMLGKVKVIYTSEVHIDPTFYASSGVFITPGKVDRDKAEFNIKTLVENSGSTGKTIKVSHEVFDNESTPVSSGSYDIKVAGGSKSNGSIDLVISDPLLWDPDHPNLYKVRTELWINDQSVDMVEEVTGFRNIRLTSDDFWINGKTSKLYGANYCHPSNEAEGSAISNNQIRKDLDDMKYELGFNTVRFAHWPFPQAAYNHSDSIGLIIMTENGYAWSEEIEIGTEGDRQTREMVFQNYNHPSIVFWSSGNENPHPGYYHYAQTIRSADSSRIIVCVDDKNDFIASGKLNIPFDHHDAVFQNKYIGWYEGEPWDWEDFTKVIHLLGEAGSGSLRTNHEPYFAADAERSVFEPEEWAQLIYEALFQTVFVNYPEQVDVMYIWHYRDVFSGKYKGYNTKGLVAAGQFKKDLYYFYQSFLNPAKEVLNLVGKHWYIREEENDIKVYSNADEVELIINGISKGVRKNGEYKHIIYENRVVNNTFYWFDALQWGKNVISIKDNRGNKENSVIYMVDTKADNPTTSNGIVYDLSFTNPNSRGVFIEMPPVINWPVYLNAGDVRKTGQEADNTFMEIPEILESTSRIVSRRMSDKNLQSEIKFKVREKSMIYLAVSKEAETRVIQKLGFVNTGIPGRWRNNSSQIEEYQVWSLKAEADEFIEIPDIPYEFAVFIK